MRCGGGGGGGGGQLLFTFITRERRWEAPMYPPHFLCRAAEEEK